MADTNTIVAEIRQDTGKGASRRLRHDEKIPAVLRGGSLLDRCEHTTCQSRFLVSQDKLTSPYVGFRCVMDIQIPK